MTAHTRLGRYRIEGELGRGGMGVVYAARHEEHGQPVAIKLLLTRDPEARERFTREATSLARLRHPNVVTVHALEEVPEGPFLVLDLIEGEGLDARLARAGPCDADEAARIGEALCLALQAAHAEGILHRDLKPSNVLLEAETGRVLLTDFGLAHDMQGEQERLTATGHVLGTPSFMAPEQMSGKHGSVDERTDVHGVGATLYAALTGRAPFRGATLMNIIHAVISTPAPAPRAAAPKTPPDLDAIVRTCMAKDPDARYPSVAALQDDLRRFRAGESVAADPGTQRRVLTITVGLALAAIGLSVWLVTRPVPLPNPRPKQSALTSATPTPRSTRPAGATARPPAGLTDERKLLARANGLRAKVTEIGTLRWTVLIPLLKREWESEFAALPPESPARQIVRDLYAEALYTKAAVQPRPVNRLKRQHLLDVLEIDPKHLASLRALARKPLDSEVGVKEALDFANRALALEPDAKTLTTKAQLLARLDRHLLALTAAGKAIQLDPKAFLPRQVQGDVYMKLHYYDDALKAYTEALGCDRNCGSLLRRGICLTWLRRFPEAQLDLKEAIHLEQGKFPAGSAYLGWSLHEAGDSNAGLEHLDQAVAARPSDAGIRLFRARVRFARGDLDGALADLDSPTRPPPHVPNNANERKRLRGEISKQRRSAD